LCTRRGLRDLPDDLHDRLARVGLAEHREDQRPVTLGEMLEAFDAEALTRVKASTRVRQGQARVHLLEHFGGARPAGSITTPEAEAWRAWLLDSGYAKATVSKAVQIARQMFRWGVKREMIDRNPFADVAAGSQMNTSRLAFVDHATIARVLDAAPGPQWRLLIVLSRYGGLRVPSEAFNLRWQDIDWERGRIWVRSPKTEHHAGGEGRWVPKFPEIRDYLLPVFEMAEPGAERVLNDFRPGYNPHTHMERIIKRAGVAAWPRIFHNLRASRQTELIAEYPITTCCAWLGNSRLVAAGHYIQTTDADWERAVGSGAESGALPAQRVAQNPAQHTPARVRK
jgi:integrase